MRCVRHLFTPDADAEWLVDEIIGHRWDGRNLEFHIKWNLGDTTWEPYSECKDLEALDNYLDLLGVKNCKQLPRKTRENEARPSRAPPHSPKGNSEERVATRPRAE